MTPWEIILANLPLLSEHERGRLRAILIQAGMHHELGPAADIGKNAINGVRELK